MVYSTLDLAYSYIYRFFDAEPTKDDKKQVIADICKLLENGWIDKDIFKAIREAKSKVPVSTLLKGKPNVKNLLSPLKFYYHGQLRVMPNADAVIVSGEELIQPEPTNYYLEMRASYTIDELVDYYISTFEVRPEDINRQRYAGAFEWFLKKYSIDLVLYMIDVCANDLLVSTESVTKPRTPMDIGEYVDKAREVLEAKRTEAQNTRNDRIIPRKRVLDFTNRGKAIKV